ncbi:hypothetical protein SAMN04488543_1622 [Friedmanniella luteola]|uniref:Uncharacterized protein n=1 Tax=Friedmanniella luteola TaxID=546871 RepID=A0A1H1RQE1_9ACTN|nr:hypothetical protein [Friedmanniella luteola]SDS37955.1 hypothetical protein SAMN04488543_1622 [Friedmanniella luteola]
MTIDRQPQLSALQLAKSLHPSAAGRSRQDAQDEAGSSGHAPAGSAGPDPGVLAVLWGEDVCRARLRSAGQGWLSGPSLPGRLPVVVASLEGDALVLVGRVAPDGGGTGLRSTAQLEVGGVSAGRRWVVRSSGLLQRALPDRPRRPAGHGEGSASRDAHPSETARLTVLVFTIRSVRGFATARRPAPARSPGARSDGPAEEGR